MNTAQLLIDSKCILGEGAWFDFERPNSYLAGHFRLHDPHAESRRQ